jgi:WD40 repeat protein
LTALAHRNTGNLLASASLDGEVRVYPLEQPGTSRVLASAGSARVNALAFTRDGMLVGASDSGGLTVWDPDRPASAPRRLLVGRKLRSVATGPGGEVAAGTAQGTILVLPRGLDGEPVELSGHSSTVTGLRFGAEGKRLASASLDGTVRVWDPKVPDREPIVLSGHSGWAWSVAFSVDGDWLLSGGADRTVRSWPTRAEPLLEGLCARVSRNLTREEWAAFLPADIPWQPTCAGAASRPLRPR